MQQQHLASVRADVNSFFLDLNAAEGRAGVVAQEFIVVAGNIDHARPLAHLAQEFLHHIVMGLWPVPGLAQAPAIDNVAHQIDFLCFMHPEEVEQRVRLAPARAQMEV